MLRNPRKLQTMDDLYILWYTLVDFCNGYTVKKIL